MIVDPLLSSARQLLTRVSSMGKELGVGVVSAVSGLPNKGGAVGGPLVGMAPTASSRQSSPRSDPYQSNMSELDAVDRPSKQWNPNPDPNPNPYPYPYPYP